VKNISRPFSFPIRENFKLLTRVYRVPVILDTLVPDLFPDLSKRRAIRAGLSLLFAFFRCSYLLSCRFCDKLTLLEKNLSRQLYNVPISENCSFIKMARKKRSFQQPLPQTTEDQKNKPRYQDHFQQNVGRKIEDAGKKFQGQGKNIL
jgi:hypothetical protein